MSVIAFIPVRGGSKSIPLKNIKPLLGKPLVLWTIDSLERVDSIDRIIIATDSIDIINVVTAHDTSKTEIFLRSSENAMDTSSTESVMLEFIIKDNPKDEDIFILVQATSPLTQTEHFSEGLHLFSKSKFDSLLSCTISKRFFWDMSGTSINYDYTARPRRQDFSGQYMENGAFYISRVGNIRKEKNRISGAIGIYEMPEYTSFEIDEPDDWIIMENLLKKYKNNVIRKEPIKLILTDVDGVLTDGGMYYSQNGDELKKFNTRDGMGFELLRKNGFLTGIVTSENTKIVENRAKKLKIDFLVQGAKDHGKLNAVTNLCKQNSIKLSEIAYIGDDVNCFALLCNVGHPFCPNNAVKKIKNIHNICVLEENGGMGVFREMVDLILGDYNEY